MGSSAILCRNLCVSLVCQHRVSTLQRVVKQNLLSSVEGSYHIVESANSSVLKLIHLKINACKQAINRGSATCQLAAQDENTASDEQQTESRRKQTKAAFKHIGCFEVSV